MPKSGEMKNENRILLILYKQNPLRHCAVEGLFVMSFCLSTFLLLPKTDGMKADTAIMLNITVVCLVCHNRIWLKNEFVFNVFNCKIRFYN